MKTNACYSRVFALTVLGAGLASAATCFAQEVTALDLTQAPHRTELRRPLARDDAGDRAGSSQETIDCTGPRRDGWLKTTLISLDRTEFAIGDEPTFQVEIENAGTVPITVPISPDLADLQLADPGQKFTYSGMSVWLWLGGPKWSANMGGGVSLYGRDDHPETMVTLNPGEWVRIAAKAKIGEFPSRLRSEHVVTEANARASLWEGDTQLTANSESVATRGGCTVAYKQGPGLPVSMKRK